MLDRPGVSDTDARAELETAALTAVKGGTTHRGDPMWMLPSLGIEVVAKHEDGEDVVVTVLPPARFRYTPGGQLGLTPLQVEAMEASVARAKGDVKAARADLAKHEAIPSMKAGDKELRREVERLAALKGDSKRRLQIAILESETLNEVLRTMRHQLTIDQPRLHRALAIAKRYLNSKAVEDPAAAQTLAAIMLELEAGK
jgi:hypothetical protein